MVVHRALLRRIGLDATPPPASADVAEAAAHASDAERAAEALERRADAICVAFLLERELYEQGSTRRFGARSSA